MASAAAESAPEPDLALSGDAAIALPETISVLPTPYAGRTPSSSGSYEVASLAPAAAVRAKVAEAERAEAAPVDPSLAVAAAFRPSGMPPWMAQPPVEEAAFSKPDSPRGKVDRLIEKYAALYEVPVALVRRVVKRESNFRPGARNGPYWGLMQILPATARSMGHSGPARELLDAETNLKYAVKYLRGAYLVADGDHDKAVRFYARGYYYDAKRKGLLDETGLGRDRRRGRV